MDNGMTMMLKSLGVEKLLANATAEFLPKIEALAEGVKKEITDYKAHVDARFDALEQKLALGFSVIDESLDHIIEGQIPAGVGATQKEFEANLETRGHLLGVYTDGE